MTGGRCIFLGRKFTPSVLFWGQESSRIFFGGLQISERYFNYLLRSVDQKIIHSNFFLWVGNFDARYLFGCKISGTRIFLGSQYKVPLDTPSCIL